MNGLNVAQRLNMQFKIPSLFIAIHTDSLHLYMYEDKTPVSLNG